MHFLNLRVLSPTLISTAILARYRANNSVSMAPIFLQRVARPTASHGDASLMDGALDNAIPLKASTGIGGRLGIFNTSILAVKRNLSLVFRNRVSH